MPKNQDERKSEQNQNKNSRKICKKEKFSKKETLKKREILKYLKTTPGFLGCFKMPHLCSLSICSYPCSFMLNCGEHWIAITVFKKNVEIFDPLGFKILKWNQFPCSLLDFLHKFVLTREIVISDKICNRAKLSVFYCLIYVSNRSAYSLSDIIDYCHRMN